MDTREAIIQLPAYLAGDLSPKEAAILEGHLAVNPEAREAHDRMARQMTPVVNLQAPEVGELALSRLFAKARTEIGKENPRGQLISLIRWGARIAAGIVVVFALGLVVKNMTPPTSDIVARVISGDGVVSQVRKGDLVEAPHGRPLALEIPGRGDLLLNGEAAVRITSDRGGHGVAVEVERGSLVVNAEYGAVHVLCGEQEVLVEQHSVAAIDFDVPFERVGKYGSLVHLQRQEIVHVARVGERVYGIRVDTSSLEPAVAGHRISLYGAGLSREDFLASFQRAVEDFGVRIEGDAKSYELVYEGAAGAIEEPETVLSVACLSGTVSLPGMEGPEGAEETLLSANGENWLVLDDGELRTERNNERIERMVVWAGRENLGGLAPSHAVDERLGDLRTFAALPAGTVILADSVRLTGVEGGPRVVKLNEAFDIPLPGSRKARLVGILSSGVELAVEGESTRYYVPLSR